jgi:hypothetical protein
MATTTLKRTKIVALKLSETELGMLRQCAEHAGCKAHDLLRYLIREQARQDKQERRSA